MVLLQINILGLWQKKHGNAQRLGQVFQVQVSKIFWEGIYLAAFV